MSESKELVRPDSVIESEPDEVEHISYNESPLQVSSQPSEQNIVVSSEQKQNDPQRQTQPIPLEFSITPLQDDSNPERAVKVSFSIRKSQDDDFSIFSHGTQHALDGFKPKVRKELVQSPSVVRLDVSGSNIETELEKPEPDAKRVTTLFRASEHRLLGFAEVETVKSVPAPATSLDNVSGLQQLKEDIMPLKAAESRWDTAFHRLSRRLAGDERYDPRKIALLDDSSSEEKLDEKGDLTTMPPYKKDDMFYYTPFLYFQRPFRKPALAQRVFQDSDQFLDDGVVNPDFAYRFGPVSVESREWSRFHHPKNLYSIIRRWNCLEPTLGTKSLPPEVDPLVQYKLERRAAELGKLTTISKRMKARTQKKIELGITPSGRKLKEYSSDSGEEQVFKRVQCRHDPDFDLLQPSIDLGPEKGSWPNPYLFFWNCKQTNEDVDEHLKEIINADDHKRKIAQELERSPMRIPYLKGDDTSDSDSSDSDTESSKEPHVTDPQRPHTLRYKFSAVREPVTDPLVKRYPYLYRHLQGKSYNKYYQIKMVHQAHMRRWYQVMSKIMGKYQTGCCLSSSYPLWYLLWKRCVRRWVRRIPRKWKFAKGKKVRTVFYGTLASIYGTQYIPEYDLLPSMDNPVQMSQIALRAALTIKEQFLIKPPDGSRPYVDYIKMQGSKCYEKYLEVIGLLCRYQPVKMPPRVRKIFFINYFNVLSIQTQIWRIPEKEHTRYLWEIKGFWERTTGLAGYLELSLEEIFHGILRCNRLHPKKQIRIFPEDQHKGFPKEMSPIRLSLDWFDPRIHFALNIGTKSCPPIQIFSLYEQDCQLDEVTRDYIRTRVKINDDMRIITLPILFLWYEKDFGNNQRVLLWYIAKYLSEKDTERIRQLVISSRPILFRYERFNDELEPTVTKHKSECRDRQIHKKIVPGYWGSRY